MAGKYDVFMGAIHCPSVSISTVFPNRRDVRVGDLIVWHWPDIAGSGRDWLGRVLGIATHDGCMKPYDKKVLAVFATNMLLTHGFERHVPIKDVVEVLDRESPRDFARWFLLSDDVLKPEQAYAAVKYGCMNDRYLHGYLDNNLRVNDHFKTKFPEKQV